MLRKINGTFVISGAILHGIMSIVNNMQMPAVTAHHENYRRSSQQHSRQPTRITKNSKSIDLLASISEIITDVRDLKTAAIVVQK